MALSETFGYEPISTASLGFDDATLARRVRLITQAMPSLKKTPNMVLKLASLNVEDDGLVRAVRRGKLFDDVRGMKFQLETQSNFEQREAWKQMSPKLRALLRATGYQGPEERGFWEHPDWLNRFVRRDIQQFQDWFITPRKEVADKAERKIGKALGHVDDTIEESRAGGAYSWTKEAIGDVAGGVGDVLGPPASAVWRGFMTGAQFPSHVYRYSREMAVDRNASGIDIFLPSGFDSDAWEETGAQMGEGYFPDYIHDRVDKILEDEAEAFWAKRMAGGDTVADLAGLYGDPGSDRYQAYYRRISEVSTSLRFQQATRTLELGKVSFGRVVANGLFTPGTEPWDMTSGLFDLAFTLVLDPYLVLGKVAKAVKIFRYSVETLEDLNRVTKVVEAAGNAKLGVNWVEDIKTMPLQQVRAAIGPEGAHMEQIARGFRDHYDEIAQGQLPSAVADMSYRTGAVKRALPALKAWDDTLRAARISAINQDRAMQGLAQLNDAERAAVPGIESITDIMQWYTAPLPNRGVSPGLEQLLLGNLGGYTRDWRQLPRATRRALFGGQAKEYLAKKIDFLAYGDIQAVRIGSEQVVVDGELRPTADVVELEATKPGHIRLWQVRPVVAGSADAILPGHIDPHVAKQAGINNWWTADIDTAREAYKGLERADLYYVDVPNSDAVIRPINAAQGAKFVDVGEYTILSDLSKLPVQRVGGAGEFDLVRNLNGTETLFHRANHMMLGWFGHAAQSVLKRVPESRFIVLSGADFVPQMERLLDLGFNHAVKQVYLEKMLFANVAQRRAMLPRVLDHLFEINGVYQAAGREADIVRKYIFAEQQLYAANGIDLFDHAGSTVPTGWLPVGHHADAAQIPDLREMFGQAQRTRLLKTMWGSVNNSAVDAFMGTYWKPSVLLRLAFVPRAAGEELLAGIMRMNPRGMLGSLAMPKYRIVDGVRERVPFVLLRPMDRLNRWVLSRVPAELHDSHWLNKFTHFIMHQGEDWLRNWAGRTMNPIDYKYAQLLGTVPAYQRAWAEGMVQVGAGVASRQVSDDATAIIAVRPDIDADPVALTVSQSNMETYGVEHEYYRAFLAARLDEVASDPAGRTAQQVLSVGMHPDQAKSLLDLVEAQTKGTELRGVFLAYEDDPAALIQDLRLVVDEYNLRDDLTEIVSLAGRTDPESLGRKAKAEQRIFNRVASLNDPDAAIDAVGDDLYKIEQRAGRTDPVAEAIVGNAEEQIKRTIASSDRFAFSTRDALAQVLVDLFLGKRGAGVNRASRELQAALLVDERAILRIFGERGFDDDLDEAIKTLLRTNPVPADRTRVYTSAPDQPAVVGTLPSERQFFATPEEAVATSIYGQRPYGGYRLWYADLTVEEADELAAYRAFRNPDAPYGLPTLDVAQEEKTAAILAQFQPVERFEVPYAGARAGQRETAERLMATARSGGPGAEEALNKLAEMVVRRRLELMRQDPATARFIEQSKRAQPSGYNARPVADGFDRVYVPLASPEGMREVMLRREAAQGVIPDSRWIDEGTFGQMTDDSLTYGLSKFQPITRQGALSRAEVEELIARFGPDIADQLAVGFVDVPRVAHNGRHALLADDHLWGLTPADSLPSGIFSDALDDVDETLESLFLKLRNEQYAETVARRARRAARPEGFDPTFEGQPAADGQMSQSFVPQPIDRAEMGTTQEVPPFADGMPPLMHGTGGVFHRDLDPAVTDPQGLYGQGLYLSDDPGRLQEDYALTRAYQDPDIIPNNGDPTDPAGQDYRRAIVYDNADGPTTYAVRWTGDEPPRVFDTEQFWLGLDPLYDLSEFRTAVGRWFESKLDEVLVPAYTKDGVDHPARTLRDFFTLVPNEAGVPTWHWAPEFEQGFRLNYYHNPFVWFEDDMFRAAGGTLSARTFAQERLEDETVGAFIRMFMKMPDWLPGPTRITPALKQEMDDILLRWQASMRDMLSEFGDLFRYDGGIITRSRRHNAYVAYNTDSIEFVRVSRDDADRLVVSSDDDLPRAQRAQERLYRQIADAAGIEVAPDVNPQDDPVVQSLLGFLDNMTDSNRMGALRRAEAEMRTQREQVREMLANGNYDQADLDDARSQLARLEDNVRAFGIDPDDPWLWRIVQTRPSSADQQAMQEWAQTVVAATRQLVASPADGRIVHELAFPGAARGRTDVGDIIYSGVEGQHMPREVAGPQVYYGHKNWWTRVVDKGFDWINKSISALAREPMFARMFQLRAQQAETAVRNMLEDPEVAGAMVRMAVGTGRQQNALLSYKTIYNQLAEVLTEDELNDLAGFVVRDGVIVTNMDLPAYRIRNAKNRVVSLLPDIDGRLPGVNPRLFDDVRAHVARMDQEELQIFVAWARMEQRIDEHVANIASQAAVNDMVPYIDNHAVRSQMAEHMRNVAPFWFAEEQFLKRWARTFVHSPEAIRKAALIYQGVREIGFVKQNEYGEDVWVVPGSGLLTDILGDVAEAITGDPYTIPVKMPFTGAVRWSLPGLTAPGQPTGGPVVGIPMTLLARRFPELNQVGDVVLQEGQTQRSIIDQLLPVSVKRFYDALAKDRKDTQYAAAMVSAMQYLEATGNGVGPDASPDEMDEYLDRIENWTRVMLLSKAMFGFVSPAPPVLAKPDDLAPELRTLLQNLPFEDALAEFMRRNPDATAYTVFKTESPSGASMATSERVGKWLDQNSEFVANHRLAVPWLLPQGIQEASNDAELSVFYRQIKAKLRQRKEPKEWLIDYAFAAAAPQYFASRDKYELARIQYKNDPIALRKIDDGWRAWKDKYYKQFPLFAEQLQSRDAHNRRVRVLGEVREALRDPNLPDGIEHKTELTSMVESYYAFDSAISALRGDRTGRASDQRAALRTTFAEWGRLFIKENPHLRAFWMRNIEPEIGLSFEQQNNLDRAA